MYNEKNTQNVYSIDQFGRIVLPSLLVRKYGIRGPVSTSSNERGEIFIFNRGDFPSEKELFMNDLFQVNINKINKNHAKYYNIKHGEENGKGYIVLTPYHNYCTHCGTEVKKEDLFYFDQRICISCFHEIQNKKHTDNHDTSVCSCCGHQHHDGMIIHNNKTICSWCYNDIMNTHI